MGKTKNFLQLGETEIQNQVREYLEWNGWFVIRHQQGLGSFKGLSDLTAIKDGKTIYVEIKKPTGSQSKDQKDFETLIKAHGGEYLLIKSLEEIEKYLLSSKIRQARIV